MPNTTYRAWRRSFVILVLVGLLSGLAIGQAAAHDAVTETSPRDGQVLAKPPARVTVTFTAPQLSDTATLVATSATGERIRLPATTQDNVIAAPWPATEPAGTYTLAWRSVGSDGHALSGQFAFTYSTPNSGPSAASPTGSPDASILPAPNESEQSTSSDTNVWIWVVVIVILLLIAVGIFSAAVRRRSKN